MRIYVPTTLEGLAAYVRAGSVPSTAERFVADDATEEAEYQALCEASSTAATLLDGPGRRVVLVAEMEDVDAGFAISILDAVHADTEDVDPSEEDLPDLGWFATQEIEDLIGSGF